MAEHINTLSDSKFAVRKVKLTPGNKLEQGQFSRSGLYALLTTNRNRILRVSLFKEAAETMCDYDTRYVAECWVGV